ncbi:MAG: hypothetical protein ACM34K_15705 [Bacillota bacterium]
MKKRLMFAAVLIMSVVGFTSNIFAQFNAGISIGDRGLRSFYLSIGNYYHVPEREVVVIHERRVPHDEIPVVFYVARHAHVSPEEVAAYRMRGCSWMEVSQHYGLGPDIYGRQVVVDGPRGNAWGYYKHNKHARVQTVYLSDPEIVSYVNTRIMTDSYGCSRDDVYRMRNQGYDYAKIHDRYYTAKYDRRRDDDGDRNYREGNSYGNGNGKWHGNGNGKGNGRGHGKWDRD